jgi:GTPase
MGKGRAFNVSGVDDLGEVHTFSSNDRERSEEMRRLMAEELESVELGAEQGG